MPASPIDHEGSLIQSLQKYIKSMINHVTGLKILYLDGDTSGIMSVVIGQSDILEKEIFLVQRIGQCDNSDLTCINRFRHMTGLYFLRPTLENISYLVKELQTPTLNEYYIYFTTTIRNEHLERLAKADKQERVQEVHQYYCDIMAINPELFSLEMSIKSLVHKSNPYLYTQSEDIIFQRIVDGLLSAFFCSIQSEFLGIRYSGKSSLCQRLAETFQQRLYDELLSLKKEGTLSSMRYIVDQGLNEAKKHAKSLLLIYDRRDDPVTPLLNQWTYQAMVHELVGIKRNRVKINATNQLISSASNIISDPVKLNTSTEIVLSCLFDSFFSKNWDLNFGDLGPAINDYFLLFKKQSKNSSDLHSIEDIQEFLSHYPQYRQLSSNVEKHVSIVHELSRIIDQRRLLDISSLEQDIACTDNKSEHLKLILNKLQLPFSNMDKLRLALLYALRYEGDNHGITLLKKSLRDSGLSMNEINLIDNLIFYSSKTKRSSDLFQNESLLLQFAKNVVQRNFKGTSNIYTQHQSYLSSIVESMIKGKVKDSQYTYLPYNQSQVDHQACQSIINQDDTYLTGYSNTNRNQMTPMDKGSEILIFVVGGITFQEAVELQHLSQRYSCHLSVGGTTIHNMESFLKDLPDNSTFTEQVSDKNPSQAESSCIPFHDYNKLEEVESFNNALPYQFNNTTDETAVPFIDIRNNDIASKKEFLRQKW